MAPTHDEEILMTEKIKKATTPKKPRATASKEAAPKATAPKKGTAKGTVTQMVSREEIARLAHQYWAERGHQDGHHEEDWYRAEQELRGKAS
jgi:hypothetical protein